MSLYGIIIIVLAVLSYIVLATSTKLYSWGFIMLITILNISYAYSSGSLFHTFIACGLVGGIASAGYGCAKQS